MTASVHFHFIVHSLLTCTIYMYRAFPCWKNNFCSKSSESIPNLFQIIVRMAIQGYAHNSHAIFMNISDLSLYYIEMNALMSTCKMFRKFLREGFKGGTLLRMHNCLLHWLISLWFRYIFLRSISQTSVSYDDLQVSNKVKTPFKIKF